MIGHASIDENGNTKGGQRGDQTKKEVCVREWYDKGWAILIRAKSKTLANKIAKKCELGCKNDNIGYNQNDRNSLHEQAKKCGYKISKVEKCNCDCSSFVIVCCICAGVKELEYYGNASTTRNLADVLLKTRKFNLITDDKYLRSEKYLRRGDILIKPCSHTCIVLTNGKNYKSDIRYYNRYLGNSNSIIDALKCVGECNTTLSNRVKIANINNIKNYQGLAEQNSKMLTLLKKGKLKRW